MSDEELLDLFRGYGYEVKIVNAAGETRDERATAHRAMIAALDSAHNSIKAIQDAARRGEPVTRSQHGL